MKKYLNKLLSSLLCVLATTAVANQDSSLDNFVKNKITTWMQENNIKGVAVELYKDGNPHSYYFGLANQQTKTPVTDKTIFEVGSITKLFTSLILAQEVNANNIKLNDSVAEYLPDLSAANTNVKNITFLNLATHTASLAFAPPAAIASRAKLKNYFQTWQPKHEIGSQWAYSNMGMGLLGDALEAVTHHNFNQLYRQRILSPLGMETIGITVPQKYEANYAQGYSNDGKAVPQLKIGLFPAAGAMKASSNDMKLFLRAAIDLEGVPNDIAKAMRLTQTAFFATPKMQQGLGWVIHPDPEKNKAALLKVSELNKTAQPATRLNKDQQQFNSAALIDKTGRTNGFISYIAVIPNQKTGIVILTNTAVPAETVVSISRQILLNTTK